MSVSTRMAKLRAMAEHPRSNPNEAAVARAELERLEKLHPAVAAAPPDLSWLDVGRAPDFESFAEMFAEMRRRDEERLARVMGPEAFARYQQRMAEWRAKRAWHDAERAAYHRRSPQRREIAHWWSALRPGDQVRTLHDLGCYEGPPLPSEVLTVTRRTGSYVWTDDGSGWRQTSYKRGEDGRNGVLTYIAPVTGW